MQKQPDLFTIKCMQCDWSLKLQPARDQDALEAECPAQPCPACGAEDTVIEFLHEAEDWLNLLASCIHWPSEKA